MRNTVSRVKPVLRWRSGESTRSGNGGREIVTNAELPPHYTEEQTGWLTYSDTLTALMLLALSRSDVRASWPKEYQFRDDGKCIPIGAAQAPLLTLMSADKILNTHLAIPYLENKASRILQPV